MTGKEQIMDKLYGALAGLFLVYGISTEEGSGKIIIELLKEAEKQLARKISECEELKKENTILKNRKQQLDGATTEAAKYKQALDEIEGIVNKKTEIPICDECAYRNIPECKENCMQDVLGEILDIISKAKGEE